MVAVLLNAVNFAAKRQLMAAERENK